MERTAPALQRVQPSPRPARKSEWLRSALAHHHCPDSNADNEIIVLATGMDQYLQEVFHHLAYTNRDDTVSAEDFTALCDVLGLSGTEKEKRTRVGEKEEDEEFRDTCSALPCQLSFKDFHSRLCGYFRVRSARRGTPECAWRMPVTEDTELVERQIRLRWPRVRRRKCVSFDLERDQKAPVNRPIKGRTAEDLETGEVAALRELVEDLRSALQGSDARCLALEVALRRRCSPALPPPSSSTVSAPTSTSITLVQGKLVPTLRIKGAGVDGPKRTVRRRRDIKDPLMRELQLIRSSRDGQLEEAMRFNGRLEEELRWAYQEVHKLHGAESALRKENTQIRRRAEEAREALSLGLQRVRLIQEQAQSVPQLQSRISQLEAELHRYRSCCTCIPEPAHQKIHPIRATDACGKTEAECLQRAVEGRAASDEEEEEEEQHHLLEATRHRMHSCSKGCQDHVVHQRVPQRHQPDKKLFSRRGRGGSEKGKRPEEEEDNVRPEDAEKTCLSLQEEKLTDALTLLLQLHNKNVSRRTLGTIIMDALDVCSRTGDGPAQVFQVEDALCSQLSSRDLLGDRGDESRETPQVPSSGCQAAGVNPLLMSC